MGEASGEIKRLKTQKRAQKWINDPEYGSEPALRGQRCPSEPGWASNSGNHSTYTIVPLRKVSRECVPSCFYVSEGFHVHANPLRTWAKAKAPINIVE